MLYLSLTLVLSPIIFYTFYICNPFEDCRSWLVVSTHLPYCTVVESGNTSTVTHDGWESCRVYVYDIVDVRTRVYQGASVPGWHIIQHRQRSFREAVWAKDRTVVWRGVGRKRGRNRKPTTPPSTLGGSLVPRSTISRQHNSSPLVHSPQPGRNINPHPPR